MKPPGGNYAPNRINVNRIPNRMQNAVEVEAVDAAAMAGNGAEAVGAGEDYRAAKVMTASPAELILIMYEQFFELIPDIKKSIGRKSAAAMEPDSERAQAIVEELINALDFDVEISRDIGAIYVYVRNRILEANIKFDAAIWDDIEAVMRSMYEGFKEASKQIEPLMKQPDISREAPSIVAGMTYGQHSLKEVVLNTKSGIKI
ncbi:MAG: flagellar export chaperone FliS [Oscillospiraceae bacterium]|nr:flagellar export chaperone FliS [Oscillospiraceae bacterium]